MKGNVKNHWLTNATHCQSPNWDDRPSVEVDTIVIHNISLPPGQFGGAYIDQLFTNRLDPDQHEYFAQICHLQVSAHVLVDRRGQLTQYVGFDKRAWHAGQSCYQGRERFNDFSIGIELEGTDWQPYDARQYETLAHLVMVLQHCFPAITDGNLVGHSTIAPQRKTDPGPAFDWNRLYGLLAAFRHQSS